MATRREFLLAGGSLLAGLALPPWLGRSSGFVGGPGHGPLADRLVEIRMKSDTRGARVWFDPIGVRVAPGTIIRWVLDTGAHSTVAYHPSNANHALRIPATAAPWDSGILVQAGQTFEQRLDVPGVYDYYCMPHELAGMVGRVLVVPGGDQDLDLREPTPASDGFRIVPAAALAAFPTIEQIRREGVVRLEP
jgi:plastocyanin